MEQEQWTNGCQGTSVKRAQHDGLCNARTAQILLGPQMSVLWFRGKHRPDPCSSGASSPSCPAAMQLRCCCRWVEASSSHKLRHPVHVFDTFCHVDVGLREHLQLIQHLSSPESTCFPGDALCDAVFSTGDFHHPKHYKTLRKLS